MKTPTKKKTHSSHHPSLLRIQRELTHYYRKKIAHIAPLSPFLQKQQQESRRFFSTPKINKTTEKELMRTIRNHTVICVGDYHALLSSQMCYLTILEKLHSEGAEPVALLESIPTHQNKMLKRWLNSDQPISSLMQKLHFDQTWGFDAAGVEHILQFSRDHHIPVYGLNLTTPMPMESHYSFFKREIHFLQVLTVMYHMYPKRKLCVLVGDMHLLPQNLPNLWRRYTQFCSILCIHQNSENLYWKYIRPEASGGPFYFRIQPHHYAIINTHPWVAYHSYCQFLQRGMQFDTKYPKEAQEELELHHQEQFTHILTKLSQLQSISTAIPPFTIYEALDLAVPLLVQKAKQLTSHEKQVYLAWFKDEIPFYLPEGHIVYLPSSSPHHVLDMGIRLLYRVSQNWFFHFRGSPANFYSWMILEAYIFWISRLINPGRQPLPLITLAHTETPSSAWTTLIRLIPSTQKSPHAWKKIAQTLSTLRNMPHIEYRWIQWFGQQWGHAWNRYFSAAIPPDISRYFPASEPHALTKSQARFIAIMKKIPVHLAVQSYPSINA